MKAASDRVQPKPYRLIALGRLPAATRDAMGDTLGSLSAMALEPGSWRASGRQVSGVFVTLGDRGFNVPEDGKFSDYATRVHRIAFDLKGAKMTLTPRATRYVRDEKGGLTTGLDPGAGTTKQFGVALPSPDKGAGAGRLAVDGEGLALCADKRFFVSDEFAANIYACAADGRMTGVITPPDAFVPSRKSVVCFSSREERLDRGRGANDGFEGLSLSPDGKTLFALLQAPLMQDRKGKPASRRYTRLLAYDVSGRRLPERPNAHYVVELPLFGEADVAEVNELVALGGGKFLVLARESFGFGAKARHKKRAIAFKQVMVASLDGATNIAGTKYERKARSIVDGGGLDKGLSPVRLRPFLNIADDVELNRVGLTTRVRSWRYKQLSAKWESLVLSPPLDAKRPRERLLFIGNDNDFRTRRGFMPDGAYDGGFEHDNLVLVYRVTLPG
jgi:hypothetical protein